MSGASSRDDGRNMDRMLKAMDCRIIFSRFTAMSSASSGVEGSKMPNSQGSSLVEEYDQGGNHNMVRGWRSSSVEEAEKGREFSLKKGPWTPREDAILIAYIQKHGNGNWNAVERNSGLGRCGKSCRLRWKNHLKPGLIKGPFTKEEEQRIIDLHATMGNKWAQLAAEFPGRTDNEIKNFWNTRLKRKKRTQDNEIEISQQQVSNGNANQHVSGSQTNFLDIREVEFRKLNRSTLLEDLSVNKAMHVSGKLAHLEQSSNSSQYNMLPMMHPSKRLHRSDMTSSSLNPSAVPVFDLYGNNRFANTSKHPSLLSSCVLKGCNQFGNNLTGSHDALYGNSSSSSDHIYGNCKPDLPSIQHFQNEKPICRMPECSLPSLESVNTPEYSIQFQTNQSAAVTHRNSNVRQGIWCTDESPLPMLQSVDTPEPNQSVFVSPPSDDGLLDSVLYRFLNSNGSNNVNSFQQNNDSFIANEAIQNSTSNPSEKQCDEQGNLRSSLGPYAASVLADYTVTKTQDDGDKHGTLTESPADYSSQEIQNLLNPVPAPDLSFIDNLYSNSYS